MGTFDKLVDHQVVSQPTPHRDEAQATPNEEPAKGGQGRLDWRVEVATTLSADAGAHHAGAPVIKVTVGPRVGLPELVFPTPSPTALGLGAAIQAARRAETSRAGLDVLELHAFGRGMQQITDASIECLYDYFQEAFVSVVFSYVAVETFANLEIRRLITSPREVLVRGQLQLIEVADIERRVSTEDKLVQILSVVSGFPAPRRAKWWPRFKRLGDDLIHLKDGRAYPRSAGAIPEASIFHELLATAAMIEYPRTAIHVIRHFTRDEPPWLTAAAEQVEAP